MCGTSKHLQRKLSSMLWQWWQWVTHRITQKMATLAMLPMASTRSVAPGKYNDLVEWMVDTLLGARHYTSNRHRLAVTIEMSMILWEMTRFSRRYEERAQWLIHWTAQIMLALQVLSKEAELNCWAHHRILLCTMARTPGYDGPHVRIPK